jgi:hypothetical protein
MGPRELEAAKGAEVARIQATRAAEAKQIVTDLGEHRAAYMNDDRIWLAMKADDAKAIGDISEVSAMASKADKRIRGMLNNPKELVRKPEQMLSALTQQETALEHLAANEPALRTAFAADESGTRAAALDRLPAALERNRALQERLGAIIGPEKSPILDAIEAAKAPRKEGIAAQLLGGKVFHVAEQAFGAVPFVGPMIGAKAAELAKSLLFGHGATAVKDGMATAARVAKDFVSKAIRGPGAPVVASRVLADTAFAPVGDKKSAPKTLEKAYERRSAELRSQTAYDATGQPKMTPEARAAMAANLAPLRMASPVLADRVETVAAARAEFLSSKLPRCPDGFDPKRWKASDMEMRTFARYVDAADHPEHVERRIVDGTISPEDAEAYRAVYPQRHAAMVSQLVQEMSQSKTPVPYMRRLSLSVFSGVPCDPSFEPSTIAALQGHFAKEHGSQGGTANPSPQAQFGSVKKSAPEPTPADKRSQGG